MNRVLCFLMVSILGTHSAWAGADWAIHGVDAMSIVRTNPEFIEWELFNSEHNSHLALTVENDVSEQKKGKYEIRVRAQKTKTDENDGDGELGTDQSSIYSFDWNTRKLIEASVRLDNYPEEAAYNKCLYAKIKADSSSPGYSVNTLKGCSFDKRSSWDIKERCWASAETNQDHWIQADFDSPVTLQKIRLYWAWYKKEFYQSKEIQIYYRDESGKDVEIKDYQKTNDVIDKECKTPESNLQQTQWTFPAVKTSQLTIKQRAGGGNEKRPNRMWINRVWAY